MTPCRCSVCTADRWAHRLLGFVAGLLVAGFLWGIVSTAASTSAQTTEAVDLSSPSSAALTAAPLDLATVPATASGDVWPVGAPSPAGRTEASERLTPMPAPRVGIASWYDDGPGAYAAAGPGLRTGNWRGRHVVVCAFEDGRSTCITVALTDWCQCYLGTSRERLIDLSADAFAQLAPLGRGLVRVTVEVPR